METVTEVANTLCKPPRPHLYDGNKGEHCSLLEKEAAVGADTYRFCTLHRIGLFAKMELFFATEDFVDTFAVEDGDPRLVDLKFLDQRV